MIDFLLGLLVGGAAIAVILHFRGDPLKTATSIEQRIQKMLSDAFNAALTNLEQVVDAKIAAMVDTGPQVDADATAAVNELAAKIGGTTTTGAN